jgi:hypothetical protein
MNQLILITENNDHDLLPQGVDLWDSFILDWKLEKDNFEVFLELSIWPESPFYKTPRKGEYTYYSKGILTFKEVQNISGFKFLEIKDSNIDPDGTRDWGNIFVLRRKGKEILFETEFTLIRLICNDIYLTLSTEKE